MKMNLKNHLSSIGGVVLGCLLALGAHQAQAQTYYTNATPGNWSDPVNWVTQPPLGGSPDAAIVFTNATAGGLSYTNDWSSGGAFLLNQLVGPGTNLNLYAPDGSALVFTSTGGVLPAITGAGGDGMSIYAPVTLGASLTLTGGTASLSFYSNITESAQSSLTIDRSGSSTYLYGANSYSGGTTNLGTGNTLYVNNGSLGSGPLYLNNGGSLVLRPVLAGAVNLANPIISMTNSGTATKIQFNQSMNISSFNNLTPVVGGAITNLLLFGGGIMTATITNANYNGGLTVGPSGTTLAATLNVVGDFTNTLATSIRPTNTLNISGNYTTLAGGGSFSCDGNLNLLSSGTLVNGGGFTVGNAVIGGNMHLPTANMAGTWIQTVTTTPSVYTNGFLNISGTASLLGGFYVRLGGTATVSGSVTNFGNIKVPGDTTVPASLVDRGATLTVYSNGVIYMTGNLETRSNGLVQVAGKILNASLRPNGGTIQLSDGTNAGLLSLGGTYAAAQSPTNTYVIGGAPLPGTFMVNGVNVTIPTNMTLGGTAPYADNLKVVKVGTGNLTIQSSNNTYTGGTIVEDSGSAFAIAMSVRNNQALGNGPLIVGTTNTTGSAYLGLSLYTQTVTSLSGGSGPAGTDGGIPYVNGGSQVCAIYGGNFVGNNGTLIVNQTNNTTFYGLIEDQAPIGNSGGSTNMTLGTGTPGQYGGVVNVIKTGSGKLTLAGQNLYSGQTTVSNGILALVYPTLTNTSFAINGGKLELDYAGGDITLASSLKMNGISRSGGIFSAATDPAFIAGTGKLQVAANPSNALLFSLTLTPAGTLTPVFAPGTLSYVAANNLTDTPTVKVVNEDLTATNWLIYNGATNQLLSGVASAPLTLAAGVNPVLVEVVSGDGTVTNTYTVDVTTAGSASTNAYLTSLVLTPAGVLAPVFGSNVFSYTSSELYSSNFTVTVIDADVTATNHLIYNSTTNLLASGVASSVLVMPANPAVTNVVAVQVTAQDGVTVKTYTVNVTQLPSQTSRPVITNSVSSGVLTLNWPLANLGYRLLQQTNHLDKGVSGNTNDWGTVAGSTATNKATITITNSVRNEYYRLVYP
ncbi:MAG: autotransporter-associated beta strand repeat-containing protein [Verrucomicrobiales bacterium]|nr:autotransporter-associated beta strand repeat-containing protein [Verrucomicrobiales bacterium]